MIVRKIKYSENQLSELRKNKHVVYCDKYRIFYSRDFRIKAAKLHVEKRLSAREIFKKAGFNLNTIPKYDRKALVKMWSRTYRNKGIGGFRGDVKKRS